MMTLVLYVRHGTALRDANLRCVAGSDGIFEILPVTANTAVVIVYSIA